jgi:hypothetical protein
MTPFAEKFSFGGNEFDAIPYYEDEIAGSPGMEMQIRAYYILASIGQASDVIDAGNVVVRESDAESFHVNVKPVPINGFLKIQLEEA